MTPPKCDGKFNDSFVANFLQNLLVLLVKEF